MDDTPQYVEPEPQPTLGRPKIGLALGGGVARGWAHIGVLRALKAAGIEPDIICGTSIGALVGGFSLSGHLDEMEVWARSLTKRRMLSYLDVLPGGSGLLGGKKLDRLMREYLDGVMIEDLPKPYTAVASELATGHEIWVKEGPLIDAIRASYALPGVFPPVKIDNRWLIDGALVNPIPVSVCRALGARLVIAVTLNHDAFGKGNMIEGESYKDLDFETSDDAVARLTARALNPQRMTMRQLFGTGKGKPGITTVMLGALNIIMDRLARSRMAGDPPDVLIIPRCGHISLVDFDRAAECIDLGQEATQHVLPYLDEVLAVLS